MFILNKGLTHVSYQDPTCTKTSIFKSFNSYFFFLLQQQQNIDVQSKRLKKSPSYRMLYLTIVKHGLYPGAVGISALLYRDVIFLLR